MGRIAAGDIADDDVGASGFDNRAELLAFLAVDRDTEVYRVAFEFVPDADIPQREELPLETVIDKLDKMEARSAQAWAYAALELIGDNPGVRAGDLAPSFSLETPKFKAKIRRLKQLGLTESLEVGYRLSPLGKAVIDR